jgi:acyl-CoA reductase-like NAD-dependent aldehyde dehydrogenase
MGKLLDEARGEVALSADILDYYAKRAENYLKPEAHRRGPGEKRNGRGAHPWCARTLPPFNGPMGTWRGVVMARIWSYWRLFRTELTI